MRTSKLFISLLATAAALTACTNDDNITGGAAQTPQTASGARTYTVSIPATIGGNEAQTRAISPGTGDKEGYLVTKFLTSENVCVYNKTKDCRAWDNDYNTTCLHPATEGATTNLTGSLTFYTYPNYVEVAEGDVLQLVYNSASSDVNYSDDGGSSYPQPGTLQGLNHWDFATAEVMVTAVEGSAETGYTLQTTKAEFVNAQSMYKFTFTGLPSGQGIEKVTIRSAGSNLVDYYYYSAGAEITTDNIEIDLGSSTNCDGYSNAGNRRNANGWNDGSGENTVYAALRFQPLAADATDLITFDVEATDGNTYTAYTATKTSPVGGFQNGKYYTSTIALIPTLSAATSEYVGRVVCAAGHLHDAKTAVPTGCTAVGILGKVTATGHGLILALQDASRQNWSTINDWASVETYASTTLQVLPDGARGANLTSYTTLGETAVSNWAVAQKSDYEAIFINLGSTKGDSGGTTYDANVNAYITTGVGGTAISSGYYWSATERTDDYGWCFYSVCWGGGGKGSDASLRPVLGF